MKISNQGIELIKHFEGLKLKPYLCPALIVTWGYGTIIKNEKGKTLRGEESLQKILKTWSPKTEKDAEDELLKELESYEKQIDSLSLELSQNEFDSLVSFIYNLGFNRLLESTLLKRIKEKKGDIKEAFLMWNKCNGKPLDGLTKRRNAESELFLTGKLIL